MEQEKGNFRGRVFGGFCRQDVIDYIEELAAERNGLRRENQELRDRVWELEEKLDASPPAEDPAADPDGASGASPEPSAAEAERAEIEGALTEARELLRSVRSRYDALCTDVKINAAQAEGELRSVSVRLAGIQDALRSAGDRLEEIGMRLEAKED